jgi:hypothetical protein
VSDDVWYHGSPLRLTTLRGGSTVTRNRDLARVFSHKPRVVSIGDDGDVQHSGTTPGFLYVVSEPVAEGDVVPHPKSTMGPGLEWLTTRLLSVTLLEETTVRPNERLTDADVLRLLASRS